ncbi:hypothetical protein GCM10027446_14570 [Angustibacter peucedani]
MRWERLFDDLEAQLAAQDRADLADEVAERTRAERARVELADRLVAWRDQPLAVHLAGGRRLAGAVRDVAQEWLLLTTPELVLVPAGAVQGLTGLGPVAATTGRDGVVRRHSLAAVLRAVARDRSPVRADLRDGAVLSGTVDAVGADHLDFAEHAPDEPRRAASVTAVRTVPFAALASLQPAPGTSSLG